MKRLYGFLLVFSLFLMTLDRVFPMNSVRWGVQTATTPLTFRLYQGGVVVQEWILFVVRLPSIYQENQVLHDEIARMSENITQLGIVTEENKTLRAQLDVEGTRDTKKVMAAVLGVVEDGYSVLYILDKGNADGIIEGQTVVTGGHLVGKVQRVTGRHAYVLPTFAVDSRVPAEIYREGSDPVSGLVRGQFNQSILFTEVLQEQELNDGDIVISNGTGGVYPADLIIGKVKNVKVTDNEVFKQSDVEPFWNKDALQWVFVLQE